jgi:hypothetical protein
VTCTFVAAKPGFLVPGADRNPGSWFPAPTSTPASCRCWTSGHRGRWSSGCWPKPDWPAVRSRRANEPDSPPNAAGSVRCRLLPTGKRGPASRRAPLRRPFPPDVFAAISL